LNIVDSDAAISRISREVPAPGCEQLIEPFTSNVSIKEG
jgi:hypothetical protein